MRKRTRSVDIGTAAETSPFAAPYRIHRMLFLLLVGGVGSAAHAAAFTDLAIFTSIRFHRLLWEEERAVYPFNNQNRVFSFASRRPFARSVRISRNDYSSAGSDASQRSIEAEWIQSVRYAPDLSTLTTLQQKYTAAAALPPSTQNSKSHLPFPIEKEVVNSNSARSVSPNVAAAILRRTTQLLQATKRRNSNSTEENQTTSRTETRSIAKHLLQNSLQAVGRATLSSPTNRLNHSHHYPITIYAACDAFCSLAALVDFESSNVITHADRLQKLKPLARVIWNRLFFLLSDDGTTQNMTGSFQAAKIQQLGVRRLSECFCAALILFGPDGANDPFLQTICHRLTKGDALSKLKPMDLASTIGVVLRVFTASNAAYIVIG